MLVQSYATPILPLGRSEFIRAAPAPHHLGSTIREEYVVEPTVMVGKYLT